MANEFTMTVKGLEETKVALEAMVADLRNKVVRQALRAAARPIVASAKEHAPVLQRPAPRRVKGTLKRNIKVINSKRANGRGGVLGVYVSVKASRRDLKKSPVTGDPYYFRWVESGHRIVAKAKRVGTYRGKAKNAVTLRERRRSSLRNVPAYPFLLPAYRGKATEAVRIFTEQITARIAKANARKR
jgi:HK97 gp10 family phage protein